MRAFPVVLPSGQKYWFSTTIWRSSRSLTGGFEIFGSNGTERS
ncbi:hypothetical protein [Streptomyces sp. CA2R101]